MTQQKRNTQLPPPPTTPGSVQKNKWGGEEGLFCTPIYTRLLKLRVLSIRRLLFLSPNFIGKQKCVLFLNSDPA